MKYTAALIVLLSSLVAQADIIKCTFTEPSMNTEYSMTRSELKMTTPSGTSTLKNISFQIIGTAWFELWDSNNNMVLKLNLNYSGSDGMSDAVYPYTAVFNKNSAWGNYNPGGCTSNYIHAR